VLDLLVTPDCAAAQGTALPKAGQEAVLAWLAAVAGTNVLRAMGGEVLNCMSIPHCSSHLVSNVSFVDLQALFTCISISE
jgi:hypothetical protein